MIYLVAVDTQRGLFGPSTSSLYEEITRGNGTEDWWHYLSNVWLVVTTETIGQLQERLQDHLQPTDKLLIVRFSAEYGGWLQSEAWDWLKIHIDSGDLDRSGPIR